METNIVPVIDPALYFRPPVLGMDSGLSLSKRLLTMQPDEPSPGMVQAAEVLHGAITTLEARILVRGRPKRSRDPRPAHIRLDRLWGTVKARLTSWAVFVADHPDRLRAAELVVRLFPRGLDFLTLPYLEEHAQSERRIRIIDEEGLREDLDRLVGEPFLGELIAAHIAYGEALGITAPVEPAAAPVSIREPLDALTRAISRYGLQVLAYADLDPDNIGPARRALSPIDEFRRAAARRGASPASPAEHDEPPGGEPVEDNDRARMTIGRTARPGSPGSEVATTPMYARGHGGLGISP